MAKLGELFLQKGVWNGRRIVSASWVAAATQAHPAAGGPYGYGWWIGHDFAPFAFAADGRGSQAIAVDPARDLVVVVSAAISESRDAAELKRLILDAIVSDTPLPADSAGRSRLAGALRLAASPPPPQVTAALPGAATRISGRRLKLAPNLFGLTSLSLTFSGPREAKAQITYAGTMAHMLIDPVSASAATGWRPVGLDGVPRLSRAPGHGFQVALDGAWPDDHTFVLHYDTVAGIDRLTFTISLAANGAQVLIAEPTLGMKVEVPAQLE